MWRPFLLLGWVNPISHYSIQPEIYLYRTVKSVERNRRKDKAVKTAIIFFFAVLSEVTATTALKFSEGFTKLPPTWLRCWYVLWRESMDWARGIGIFLIRVGILIINLFSKSAAH